MKRIFDCLEQCRQLILEHYGQLPAESQVPEPTSDKKTALERAKDILAGKL
jgi:hypothetical protein